MDSNQVQVVAARLEDVIQLLHKRSGAEIQADWDALTRGRALRRVTYEMWLRNARHILGQDSC